MYCTSSISEKNLEHEKSEEQNFLKKKQLISKLMKQVEEGIFFILYLKKLRNSAELDILAQSGSSWGDFLYIYFVNMNTCYT